MEFLLGNIDREVIFTSLMKHVDVSDLHSLQMNFSLTEGDVVAVKVESAVGYPVGGGLLSSSLVEDRNGALRVLFDGAIVITALGSRESTYWNVASINGSSGPKMQLVSHSGLCSYIKTGRNGNGIDVHVLGSLVGKDGEVLNIKSRWKDWEIDKNSKKRPVSVFVGTSAEVGKTTTLLNTLRAIRKREPAASIMAIKMSGTPSEAEINLYRSYGASKVLNLVDLGFPTSYTGDKETLMERIRVLLWSKEFQTAAYVLIELGGDVIGGTNSEIIDLLRQETYAQFFLSAFDCFGAAGCSRYLGQRGVKVTAITGKCVSNSVVKSRTQELCRLPALSALDEQDLCAILEIHNSNNTSEAVRC